MPLDDSTMPHSKAARRPALRKTWRQAMVPARKQPE